MRRNHVRSRSQLDLMSALCHYLITRFDAAKDLYFLAIIGAQRNRMLHETVLIQTNIHRIKPLFFNQRLFRNTYHILYRSRKQINLNKRPGNDSALVVKLKTDRQIERIRIGSFAKRQQLAIEIGQPIDRIVVRRAEIGRADRRQQIIDLF